MKPKLFSVYDSKIESYDKPFMAKTRGEAIRGFRDFVNEKDNMVSRHPEDYTLFEIGEYDEEKGLLLPHKAHHNCGKALDYKEKLQ
jgi:hypothetical protein